MAQVLNQIDRNQSFIKFLIFFLVTIVLVVGAVFVNYKLPSVENSRLREQVNLQRESDAGEEKFIAMTKEAVSLVDSMKEGSPTVGALKAQLDIKIASLDQLLQAQSNNTVYGRLNNMMVRKLDDLGFQKARVSEISKELSVRTASLEADVKKYRDALEAEEKRNATLGIPR